MAERTAGYNYESTQTAEEELHKSPDGRLLMIHEARSAEQRSAIISNTIAVPSRQKLGSKAIETLTTEVL